MESRKAYHLEWTPQGQWGRSKAAGKHELCAIGLNELAPASGRSELRSDFGTKRTSLSGLASRPFLGVRHFPNALKLMPIV